MIRFLRTSDLHLGKPFGAFPEEVRHRLRQDATGALATAARDGGAKAFAEALVAESDALALCEARTLAEARDRARQRQTDENAAKQAEQMLRSLAPSGVEALDQALAHARKTIKGVSDAPVRPAEQVASELEAEETREAEHRGRLHASAETVADAPSSHASRLPVSSPAEDSTCQSFSMMRWPTRMTTES